MTVNELRNIPREWLTPREISSMLKCDPQSIRAQAHSDPAKLGFPVVVIGKSTRIPKEPFLALFEQDEKAV